ncbi:MAG TPA: amphi-Trp domain-containing protein [bacterium]|nr:amphi-Trp domain-containing protein [bacterium]
MARHNDKGDKFDFSATLEASQVADYLVRIADGLRRGVVRLAAGERGIRLEPTAMLAFEIEAEGKPEKTSGSIAMELSWKPEYASAAESLEITVDPQEEGGREPVSTTKHQ